MVFFVFFVLFGLEMVEPQLCGDFNRQHVLRQHLALNNAAKRPVHGRTKKLAAAAYQRFPLVRLYVPGVEEPRLQKQVTKIVELGDQCPPATADDRAMLCKPHVAAVHLPHMFFQGDEFFVAQEDPPP